MVPNRDCRILLSIIGARKVRNGLRKDDVFGTTFFLSVRAMPRAGGGFGVELSGLELRFERIQTAPRMLGLTRFLDANRFPRLLKQALFGAIVVAEPDTS